MLNFREYRQKPDCLSDFLPWAYLAANGVMFNKDGSFQKTIRFRGPDMDSKTPQEVMSICARVNNALMRIGEGWAIFAEARRLKSNGYPEPTFPDPVSLLIDCERADIFQRDGVHFESDFYLTFVRKTPTEAVTQAKEKMYENITEEKVLYQRYLEYFIKETDKIVDILQSVFPFITECNNAETLTYLHSTISTKRHPVKPPEIPMYLDAFLADEPLKGGIEPVLGEHFIQVITIRSFPGSSLPGLLGEMNTLPFEFRWMNRYIPLDKELAKSEITKLKRRWFAKRKGFGTLLREMITKEESALHDSSALMNSADADEALQEVGSGTVNFGKYTSTVVVWDKDPQLAIQKIREIERVINTLGFICIRETINAVQGWLSSIPGQVYANVRLPVISSMNLSHLLPVFALWAGPEKNEYLGAPPLLHATTSGNTPFRLVNHVDDVGHTMILGPTGKGKSVLLNLIKAQFLRYKDAQVFTFDKNESCLALTYGVGGEHCDIGSDKGLTFQPLQLVDQKSEKIWAVGWLCELLENEKYNVTSQTRNLLSAALQNLAEMPQHQRTLTGLSALIQDEKLRDAIKIYTLEGDYGNLLDASRDTLSLSNWHSFEMGTLLGMPHVAPIVLSYLFHRLDEKFTGKPTLLCFDEAWEYLSNKIMVKKIGDWLLTARKNNVSVIFSTAGLATIADNPITDILIESCPTRIFLPNPEAKTENMMLLYRKFGLNETQLELLATAIAKQDYYYQSPLGNRLFNMSLNGATLAFCGSGSKDDRKLIKEIKSASNTKFPIEFLKAKGLTGEVDILEQAY